jgi:MerR family transcriptional regulator/heat shock protein HspR
VQPAFLRRLDSEHVVEPARSDGGQRRYSRREIERIERIAELATEGLSLDGIKRLLVLEAEVTSLEDQLSMERRKNKRKN